MDIEAALITTCQDAPGSIGGVALRLGKNINTFRHELNPPAGSSAKMGLRTAMSIMLMTGDTRLLSAMAAELGCMVMPLPSLEALGDESVEHLATVTREFADVLGEVAAATVDGAISDNEMARIERQWGDLVAAGTRMVRHLRGKNLAAKPSAAVGIDRAREAA